MGWLFGKKKKVPKVPLPAGKPFDENSLQFPQKISTNKVIKPGAIKSAVGFDKPPIFPKELQEEKSIEPVLPMEKEDSQISTFPNTPGPKPMPPVNVMQQTESNDLFVKVEVYQRILGELDLLRDEMTKVSNAQKHLETSEFNEEKNFEKLKRSMKGLHDNMLHIDKILFKV